LLRQKSDLEEYKDNQTATYKLEEETKDPVNPYEEI
jgi:hypothetical protein